MDIFAIQLEHKVEQIQHISQTIAALAADGSDRKVALFLADGIDASLAIDGIEKIETVKYPEGVDTIAKKKNFIIDWFEKTAQDGFLHIIEDSVELLLDPTQFINSVQNAMDVLDYASWFSTTSDRCNYVFKKFCPRIEVAMDNVEVGDKLGLKSSLMFTSHANLAWTIYRLGNGVDHIQRFNELFQVGMFTIIEYFARRRRDKQDGQLFFMNQYMTVKEEIGMMTIHALPTNETREMIQAEDSLFKSLEIEFSPDNNVDVVLETLFAKIKQKMA